MKLALNSETFIKFSIWMSEFVSASVRCSFANFSPFVTTKFTLHFFNCQVWFPYSRYQSLNVVDGLSRPFEFLGLWESLPVVGCLGGSLIGKAINGISKSFI